MLMRKTTKPTKNCSAMKRVLVNKRHDLVETCKSLLWWLGGRMNQNAVALLLDPSINQMHPGIPQLCTGE